MRNQTLIPHISETLSIKGIPQHAKSKGLSVRLTPGYDDEIHRAPWFWGA